ncbi:MAG: hypothetical protein ABIA63_05620 [bacterium]
MKYFPGKPLPLGATYLGKHTQFSIFSRNADQIYLQFFKNSRDSTPKFEIRLEPEHFRTGDIWHVAVKGVKPGQLYGYRIDGPYAPLSGMRFNKNKLLVDPLAKAVTGNFNWTLSDARGYDINSGDRDISFSTLDSCSGAPKSILLHDNFNWGNDRNPRTSL